MTKKSHQKFWRMNTETFLLKKVHNVNIFHGLPKFFGGTPLLPASVTRKSWPYTPADTYSERR